MRFVAARADPALPRAAVFVCCLFHRVVRLLATSSQSNLPVFCDRWPKFKTLRFFSYVLMEMEPLVSRESTLDDQVPRYKRLAFCA